MHAKPEAEVHSTFSSILSFWGA